MEIFTSGVGLLQKIINLIGGGLVIIGIIMYLMANSDNNPAGKQQGMALFISGAGVALVANTLIPMLANLA